ncbi:hypothetical protein BGX26_002886 [Mortierella sp. AD094]|nr:hypothetical protein BGX26_002886 [Mortierella sp. AD094]
MFRALPKRQDSDVVIKMETIEEGHTQSSQVGSSEQERIGLINSRRISKEESQIADGVERKKSRHGSVLRIGTRYRNLPLQDTDDKSGGSNLANRGDKTDIRDYRWFFEQTGETSHTQMLTTSRVSNPVLVNSLSSELKIKHTILKGQVPSSHYYLVLGISLDQSDPNIIKNVRFIYTTGNSVKEIELSDSEIKGLTRTEDKMDIRIRLHYGLDIQAHQSCSIDITFSFDECAPRAASTMRLNYLELLSAYLQLPPADNYVVYGTELENRLNSIRVCHGDYDMPEKPVHIKAICVSDTQSHIATMSLVSGEATVKVWSLGNDAEGNETFPCIATKQVTLSTQDFVRYPNMSVALSRDGTNIVVCQAPSDEDSVNSEEDLTVVKESGKRNPFSFFLPKPSQTVTACIGYGKFTTPSSKGEMFLRTDGNSILIYNISPEWSKVFSIPLNNIIPPTWGIVKSCIESLRGPYFAWSGDPRALSLWRIDRGSMVSFISTKDLPQDGHVQNACKVTDIIDDHMYHRSRWITRFSNCQQAVAVAGDHILHIFLMPSATLVKTLDSHIFGPDVTIVDLIWAESRPELSVLFHDENNNHQEFLVSLKDECTNWSEEKSICSGAFATPHVTHSRTYTAHGSTVDICDITALQKARNFGTSPPGLCTEECEKKLGELTLGEMECRTESGLTFRIDIDEPAGVSEVVMINEPGISSICLRIPSIDISTDDDQSSKSSTELVLQTAFLNSNSRFIVFGTEFVMVWKLPLDQNERCELITMKKVDIGSETRIGLCAHDRWLSLEQGSSGEIFFIDLEPLQSINYINVPDCEEAFPFLVKFYDSGQSLSDDYWASWREALIRYVGRHLNSCPAWNKSSNSFLKKLCQTWELEDCEQWVARFLGDLLLSPGFDILWFPSAASSSHPKDNPIFYALEQFRDQPRRNPILHTLLIDHCFVNAKRAGDIFFLIPVLSCMQLITHFDEGLVLDITHRIAFIPIRDQDGYRSFILDNATDYRGPLKLNNLQFRSDHPFRPHFENIGIYSSSSKSNFTKPSLKLYRPQVLNHQAKHFKGKLYISPIAALWTIQDDHDSLSEWPVQGHALPLKAYDNPAFEAALEYKWRKDIVTFWFLLAMRVIFSIIPIIIFSRQGTATATDDPVERPTLLKFPLEIVGIIIIGAQIAYYVVYGLLIRAGSHVVLMWILAFTTAFSMWAFIALTAWSQSIQSLAISFIFIYIMIMDTLRTFKSVSRFFSFIFRLAREIGIFLVMFTLGILAFTHVFWVLLRGCLGQCEVSSTKFPSSFSQASFATLFFLAGRYDPVSDEMDGDSYTFLFVMTLYYLFSAIIMLNVLIGLVNVALNQVVDTNDNEWLLTWLQSRYLSLLFNAKWNAFNGNGYLPWPYGRYNREVYYTASDEEIKLYNEKYFPEGNGDMMILGQDSSLKNEISISNNPSATFEKDSESGGKSEESEKIDKLQEDFEEMKSILQRDLEEMKSVLAQLLAEKRQAA